MSEEILNFGELRLGSRKHRWRFSFDYNNHLQKFKEVVGKEPVKISFKDFTRENRLGEEVLNLSSYDKNKFWRDATPIKGIINKRDQPNLVEFRYICNFLGTKRTQNENDALTKQLIKNRINQINKEKPKIHKKFIKKWGH